MKRGLFLSIGMLVLLAATLPLVAQAPDGSHIFAYPPIRISNMPQSPAGPSGILPVQFKAAYGFNQVPNLGKGQTIALVDAYDDPNIASDLAFYASYFLLTPCNFQKVKVGSPSGNSGWALEESLDVEQACALAPQANIILVEANSNSFDDLLAAVQVASSAPYNATTVSMSWGGSEFDGEQSYDSYFCNISNANGAVTFFASSGDGGHGTIYPSASPCVIAVGGTTLTLSSALPLANPLQLNYGTENAWRDGGGGVVRTRARCHGRIRLAPPGQQPIVAFPTSLRWPRTYRCMTPTATVAGSMWLARVYPALTGPRSLLSSIRCARARVKARSARLPTTCTRSTIPPATPLTSTTLPRATTVVADRSVTPAPATIWRPESVRTRRTPWLRLWPQSPTNPSFSTRRAQALAKRASFFPRFRDAKIGNKSRH